VHTSVDASWLVAFLLAATRVAAWVAISPPFSSRSVPATAKAALSMALALPVASRLAAAGVPLDTPGIIAAVFGQVLAGVALGFVVYLLFAALQAAGDLVDLFGGFTLAAAYDPLSQNSSGPLGRAEQLIATTLLLVTNGHLVLVRGLLGSFDALPLIGSGQKMFGTALIAGFGRFFVSALEVAGPLLAVLFVAEIGVGLLGRAAPALNVMNLAPPVKILLTLLILGAAFPLLPNAVTHIIGEVAGVWKHLGAGP